MQDSLEQIKYIIPIDEDKGYYIDYPLTRQEPIKMRNSYLEINSKAFFYNEKISDT